MAVRRKYPGQRILVSRIDYKSSYCQGILHFTMVLKTVMQLPDDAIASSIFD